VPGRIKTFLRQLTLSQRFMLAGLLILFLGMLGIGAWVEQQIVTGVIHRTGTTTALYVDSFVAPKLQELGQSNELLPENAEALDRLLRETRMGQEIVALKVWDTRGRLLYTTDQSVVGKSYPMHAGMLRARLGEVVSRISPLDDEESQALAQLHDQLLEIYSPVWLSGTDQIIAVAEFYQRTEGLERETNVLKLQSWLVVGLAILVIYLLLAWFVRRTSSTITLQQAELSQQVIQLTDLLAQNRELHERVRRAAASVALLNEGYLKRIGSELHDGPAQDLGLSLLKLDALAGRIEDQPQAQTPVETIAQLQSIEAALQNALKEIRGIAAGLGLPELASQGLPETVTRVVRAHERQTGTSVALDLVALPEQVALPLKITIYRLIQEALNNAFRHAGGAGQRVRVGCFEERILVEVSDSGPGFDPQQSAGRNGRLGLSGMRERVESLGGMFRIDSQVGQGAKVLASLPVQAEGGDENE
jgi:signal transduction histidine kinase